MDAYTLRSFGSAKLINEIVNRLQAAGVDVPAEILDAQAFAKLKPLNLPGPKQAEQQLAAATDQESFDAACWELAVAQAAQEMVKDGRVQAAVNSVRESRVTSAVRNHVVDLLDTLGERYDAQAKKFKDALDRLPENLASLSALDIDEATAKALRATRDAHGPLAAIYAAAQALWTFAGWRPVRQSNPSAVYQDVDAVAEFNTEDAREHAAELLRAGGALAPFGPFAAAVKAGGRLRLHMPA